MPDVDLKSERATLAALAAAQRLDEEHNTVLLLPGLLRCDLEEACAQLSEMPKPMIAASLILYGGLAVATWPGEPRLYGPLLKAILETRNMLLNDVRQMLQKRTFKALLRTGDPTTLVMTEAELDAWFRDYFLLGVDLAACETVPRGQPEDVRVSIDVLPARAVIASDQLWKRFMG